MLQHCTLYVHSINVAAMSLDAAGSDLAMDQHAGGTLQAARHPLDPLDAAEITLAVAVLRAKAPVSDQLR